MGLTQRELAARFGVNQTTIGDVLRNAKRGGLNVRDRLPGSRPSLSMRYQLTCGHSVVLPEQTFTALADPGNWQFCDRCQDARKFARRKHRVSPLLAPGG